MNRGIARNLLRGTNEMSVGGSRGKVPVGSGAKPPEAGDTF